MSTEHITMSMIRGDTKTFYLVFDGEGLSEDLTQVWCTCRKDYTSENTVFEKTLTGGGVTKESTNRYLIRIDPMDTLTTLPGVYKYDVQYQYGEDVYTPIIGDLVINYGVTDAIVVSSGSSSGSGS